MKILNAPVPPAFRESVRYAEQNLYTRAKELVGDRDPRAHEFSVQLRALDNDRTGTALGLPALMALCSGVLEKSTKGGLIVVGALNLGGSVEPLANAVGIVEVAIEKGADTVLMPVSARKQLFELSDDMATRQHSVLFGYAGCAAEGAARVVVVYWNDARPERLPPRN